MLLSQVCSLSHANIELVLLSFKQLFIFQDEQKDEEQTADVKEEGEEKEEEEEGEEKDK